MELDEQASRQGLRQARTNGFNSVAIVLLHGYRHTDHESRLAHIARELGFEQISVSHEVSALMKIVPRGDTTVVDYAFNDDAETFYHVKLEVDYLTESHANTDGHLADRIDDYTRTDRYQYVLEVDADNQIIGGEWIGTSKKNHPDFLWLPTERSNWPPPASGSLNWDLVKDLLDQSMIEEEPEIEDGASSSTISESFSIDRSAWRHFGPFTVEGTLKATLTGTNDADLYVHKGSEPTTEQYTCRPYSSHSNEDCAVAGPGEIYVSVRGYSQAEVCLLYTSPSPRDS